MAQIGIQESAVESWTDEQGQRTADESGFASDSHDSKTGTLPKGPYSVILADPPWKFSYWSEKAFDTGRHVSLKYDLMDTDAICRLPVGEIAAPDSVLFLWATWPNLLDALRVIEAWGFTYRTLAFVWVKTARGGQYATGMGYYTRSNSEPCLLATRGKTLPRRQHDVGQILDDTLISLRREHSRKPDGQYARIERLFGDVPRVELFARQRYRGWDSWGNQVSDHGLLPLEGVA